MSNHPLKAKEVAKGRQLRRRKKFLKMNIPQFEGICQKFDWQWYWRDCVTVADQVELMTKAQSLGNTFIVVYENYRLKARNPYCPLLNAKLAASTTSLKNNQVNHPSRRSTMLNFTMLSNETQKSNSTKDSPEESLS